MSETVKIKFTRPYAVKAAKGETYREGQTVEVNRRSADHFIARNAAEEVGDEPVKAAKAVEPAGKPADDKPDFDSMTKADLEEYATKNKIKGVTQSMTKDEMVTAIKRAPIR